MGHFAFEVLGLEWLSMLWIILPDKILMSYLGETQRFFQLQICCPRQLLLLAHGSADVPDSGCDIVFYPRVVVFGRDFKIFL